MNPLAIIAAIATQTSPDVTVKIDPRFEVLAISLWLSGQYPTPTDSAYKLRVWNHFQKYRKHPAILALQKSKNMYTDFTELGLSLENWPNATVKDNKHWREIMGDDAFNAYFTALPSFIKDTGFVRFFDSNAKDYKAACAQFEGVLQKEKTIEAMEVFYRYGTTRPKPKFEVFLEPLNNWGAHAIVDPSTVQGDNTNPVRYQLGNWSNPDSFLDSPLNFSDVRGLAATAWHEGSHVYVAPVFRANTARIAEQERLFNREALKSQNISTWEYCLNENVVRAVTAVLIKQTRGDQFFQREITNQVTRNGFIYTGTIADWILKDYVGNSSYQTFDDFFPAILERLKTLPDYKG